MTKSAGFFPRLIAFLIDKTIITFIPLTIVYLAWFKAQSSVNLFAKGLLGLIYYLIFLSTITWWLYLSITTFKLGATLGKLITGLKVVNQKGKKLSFKLALFRYPVGYTISSLIFGLGFIWIIFNHKNHSWHDLFTNTYVSGTPKFIRSLLALVLLLSLQAYLFINLVQSISSNQAFTRQLNQYYQSTIKYFENSVDSDTLFLDNPLEYFLT